MIFNRESRKTLRNWYKDLAGKHIPDLQFALKTASEGGLCGDEEVQTIAAYLAVGFRWTGQPRHIRKAGKKVMAEIERYYVVNDQGGFALIYPKPDFVRDRSTEGTGYQ